MGGAGRDGQLDEKEYRSQICQGPGVGCLETRPFCEEKVISYLSENVNSRGGIRTFCLGS